MFSEGKMMEDSWVLLIVLACFYPVYLWVEWVRKAGDEAIKKMKEKVK